MDSLFAWFPASWMLLVIEVIREKSFAHDQAASQMNASTSTDQTEVVLPEGLDFTFKVMRKDAALCYSHLHLPVHQLSDELFKMKVNVPQDLVNHQRRDSFLPH